MLAIIGGTGLAALERFELRRAEQIKTSYQDAAVIVSVYGHGECEFAFLPRHGGYHKIPPHKINYRANLWALKEIGARSIIAVNAVGGIHPRLGPGNFAIPDQLIDYTYSRAHTFFEENLESVIHVDFTKPYSERLRRMLLAACNKVNASKPNAREVLAGGTYACTQGPRLETAAEIQKLKRDGGDMVGMTAMPEAVLARELNLDYAAIALSVNWAAGLDSQPINFDAMESIIAVGGDFIAEVLRECVAAVSHRV